MSEIKKHISVSQIDSGHGILTYLTTELKDTPSEDGFPEIGITTKTKHVELETYRVKSTINGEQIKDLDALHGIDAMTMVESALMGESSTGQEKQIYKKMKLLGYESNRKLWTKIQNLANKWTGYIPMVDVSKNGELVRKVLLLSNQIAAASRIGPANFVIIGPGLLPHFSDSEGFSPIEHDSSMGQRGLSGLIYKCGVYRGKIEILVNPNLSWKDKRVVIGRNNGPMNEGIFLVEHSEGECFNRSERVNPASLRPEIDITLIKRYGLVHTQNASKNYITITCTDKKHNIVTHIIDRYFKKKK
jgi:hypothetical protein